MKNSHFYQNIILMILASLLICLACAGYNKFILKKPFLHSMRQEYDLNDKALKDSLQYYVSNTVKLQIEVPKDNRYVKDGKLIQKTTKVIEEVIVDQGTPGVAIFVDSTQLAISFEKGSALIFETVKYHPKLPVKNGVYWLKYENGMPSDSDDTPKFVKFNGADYTLLTTKDVYLLVNQKLLDKLIKKHRKLPGRKLD